MTPPLATARRAGGPRRGGRRPAGRRLVGLLLAVAPLAGLAGGCGATPRVLAPDDRKSIDRRLIEVQAGYDIELYATGLDQPVGLTIDADGNLIVAEGGIDGSEPRVYGFAPGGARFDLYPVSKPIVPLPLVPRGGFRMYGPVGGVLAYRGEVYVSHRDADGYGVITALNYKGGARTVVSGFPARGENGITGMAADPATGRLFFGVGSATNSGVVGPDNLAQGWVADYPDTHDVPYKPVTLLGAKFLSRNPGALWFNSDVGNTGVFQPYNTSSKRRIDGATENNPRCNSAILSVSPEGGDVQVHAYGIRLPKGLAFSPGPGGRWPYNTSQGMEMRGSRPVKDDPDVLLHTYANDWFGFPDHSADLHSITEPRFQPPEALIFPSGYPDLSPVLNLSGVTGLNMGAAKETVVFPSQSGASGLDFVPTTGPFMAFAGNALVALSGDRAPFATSGQKLKGPSGFKVVQVDPNTLQVRDFVRNVRAGPSSRHGGGLDELERPVDVKFGPDGAAYILDMGRVEYPDARPRVAAGTGRIYRLLPSRASAKP